MQANPATYGFFTQVEVNASSASRYASGVSDGNTSGIALVVANPASYQLFTPSDLNQSGLVSYAAGFADGNTSGVMLVTHPGLFGYFTAPGSGRLGGTGEKGGFCGIAGHGTGGFGTTKSFLCSLSRKDECQGSPHP